MSYNGNGVFLINTAGQPVVASTVISATTFNLLTADLANGLTNAITKDGQTTVTANIPMSNFKITGLGAATAANDAVRLAQIQDGIINGRFVNLEYTGTFTGGTGVLNIGSGSLYKAAGGNVGIATTSPDAKLHVNGAFRQTGASTPFEWTVNAGASDFYKLNAVGVVDNLIVANTAGNVGIGTNSPGSKLDVNGTAWFGTGDKLRVYSNNVVQAAGTLDVGTVGNSNLNLITNNGTKVIVHTAGNLLIGTASNTGSRLVVAGDVGTSVGNGASSIRMTNTATGSYASISGGVPNVANAGMDFSVNGTRMMIINDSGDVLVGCTGVPTSGTRGLQLSGLGFLRLGTNVTSTVGQVSFNNPNGEVGLISVNGTTTTYATSSDYRLKENVAPMQNALATVTALKPCTYTWKADGSAGQGFIAHELKAVVPDCVVGEKDAVDADGKPKYQGVDSSFLIATLVAAIQELKAEVDLLKGN